MKQSQESRPFSIYGVSLICEARIGTVSNLAHCHRHHSFIYAPMLGHKTFCHRSTFSFEEDKTLYKHTHTRTHTHTGTNICMKAMSNITKEAVKITNHNHAQKDGIPLARLMGTTYAIKNDATFIGSGKCSYMFCVPYIFQYIEADRNHQTTRNHWHAPNLFLDHFHSILIFLDVYMFDVVVVLVYHSFPSFSTCIKPLVSHIQKSHHHHHSLQILLHINISRMGTNNSRHIDQRHQYKTNL